MTTPRAWWRRFVQEDWIDVRWGWTVRTDRWAAWTARGPVAAVLLGLVRRGGVGTRAAGVWLGKATLPGAAVPLVARMLAARGATADALALQVGKWADWSGRGPWRTLPPLPDALVDHVVAAGLAHPRPDVRRASAILLGRLGDGRFAPPLGERVRDELEDEGVRTAAVLALAALPRAAALPELNASAGIADGRVRTEVALFIGDDMTPEARRAMVQALDDEDLRRDVDRSA